MSKMKQYLESEVVITRFNEESTGWKRYIAFNYQGNEYELTLFWDEFNGYDIYWRVPDKAPDWAVKFAGNDYEGESLAGYLDLLTWEMNK